MQTTCCRPTVLLMQQRNTNQNNCRRNITIKWNLFHVTNCTLLNPWSRVLFSVLQTLGLSMSACRVPAWPGVVVAQQRKPIIIVIPIIIVVAIVTVISWLYLRWLDTPLPPPSQVRTFTSQEYRDCRWVASPPTELGHFRKLHSGYTPGNAPTPSPNRDYLHLGFYHPVHSPGCLLRWGLAPALPIPVALPPGLFILFLAHQGFGNQFPALAGLRPSWVRPSLVPTGLCRLRAASLWCFALRAYRQWHCTLGIAFLFCISLGLYHLRLDHPGLRRIWTAAEGFYRTRGLATFGDYAPFGAPPPPR
jgi:hypothetical protein